MEVTFHATTSFYGVHVILKTITRTRTLKGGGFGLTLRLDIVNSSVYLALIWLLRLRRELYIFFLQGSVLRTKLVQIRSHKPAKSLSYGSLPTYLCVLYLNGHREKLGLWDSARFLYNLCAQFSDGYWEYIRDEYFRNYLNLKVLLFRYLSNGHCTTIECKFPLNLIIQYIAAYLFYQLPDGYHK